MNTEGGWRGLGRDGLDPFELRSVVCIYVKPSLVESNLAWLD